MKKFLSAVLILAGLLWSCGSMEKTVVDDAANIVKNGDFSVNSSESPNFILGVDNTAHWVFNLNPGDNEGKATAANETGVLHIGNITKPGSQVWSIQLLQFPITINQGGIYKVVFDARAAEPREVMVKIGGIADRNWSDYSKGEKDGTVVQLDDKMKTHEFTFTMDEPTDNNARFEFQLGMSGIDVWIDNVKLLKIGQNAVTAEKGGSKTPVSPSELIKNGNFDEDFTLWEEDGDIQMSVENGELFITVNGGSSVSSSDRLKQPGIAIEANEEYLLSFIARSGRDLRMNAGIALEEGSEIALQTKSYAVSKTERYFSYYFKTGENFAGKATLYMEIGDILNGAEEGFLALDRISLKISDPYMNPGASIEARVENLLSLMTLEEKAGQMVQAERSQVKSANITDFGIGSILSGGGSVPKSNTPEGWIELYNSFQQEALASRLGIPMIYGIDAVHGHTNVQNSTGFPHNIGLGATRNPKLIEEIGRITAAEVRATGLNWTFAPCVAVSRDIRWGRIYESYGENPEIQDMLSAAYVRGLQGKPGNTGLLQQGLLAGCAKHFMGDGAVEYKTGENSTIDRGNITTISIEDLKRIHGVGFKSAINEGVLTVMASYNSFGGRHMHAYGELLNDYLKAPVEEGGLGFKGYVIGDWDAMGNLSEIEGTYADKVLTSFNAGVDMSMEQAKWKEVIEILLKGVEEGRITEERINDAVRRILTVKIKTGLFEAPYALKDRMELLGSPEHRKVAAQAVRESLVLLKNENKTLPLKKGAKVFVSGPLFNNTGYQNGGWTIEWQGGKDTNGKRYIKGTTILEGIQAQAAKGGGEVITSFEEAQGKAEVAVVVVGESPYAEMKGDVPFGGNMTLKDVYSGKTVRGSIEAINKALELKIPVVVILISGRPLVVTDEIGKWDAFVAAWLPGTEGAAVADVLYGDQNFKGTLPVSWPKSVKQLPLTVLDEGYGVGDKEPLFKYGFGLKY